MIVDLGDVIDAEAVPGVARRIKVGGSYNTSGEWVGETESDVTIIAAVFPATGRALMDMPEGERAEARYLIWTRVALGLDDVITYLGNAYKVIYTWPRPEGGFTRAALGRMRT